MFVRPTLVPEGVTPISSGPMEMPTGDKLMPVASTWMRRGEMLSAMGSTITPAKGNQGIELEQQAWRHAFDYFLHWLE